MIEFLVTVIAFGALCAAADRLRGTDNLPALVAKTIFAGVASLAVFSPEDGWWALLLFILLFIAGSSYGWGRPLGLTLGGQNDPEPERWQVGPLMDTRLALVTRGAMWLGPVSFLSLATGNPNYAFASVAMTVAFTAAPYIANAIEPVVTKRWELMEYIRGALFGTLTVSLTYATY